MATEPGSIAKCRATAAAADIRREENGRQKIPGNIQIVERDYLFIYRKKLVGSGDPASGKMSHIRRVQEGKTYALRTEETGF